MNRIFVAFCGLALSFQAAEAQSLVGDWSGKLQVTPAAALKLVIHVAEGPAVTMDSPDQGAYGIKGQVVHLSADSLNFRVPMLGASYAARLEGGRLEGTFAQGGLRLPLTLEPGARKAVRPQTPRAPFPYRTEEITVPAGDATLAGTLTLPADAAADTPLVVMVTGSGLQNRDEEVFEHRPFAVIADYLARNGIASFRYDDRGCGASTGNAATATTADFASDARAVVDRMRALGKFGRVGLLGHSEGGMVAYMLGARPATLDFIVSVAGPAVRGDSILVRQNLNALAKSGITGAMADNFKDALQKAFRLKIDDKVATLDDATLSEIYPTWNESAITRKLADGIRGIFSGNVNPWMQYFISYSPGADLAALHIPALLIYGEKDVQVPASLNAPAARALAPGAEIKVYPGLNHLMQHAATGNVEEYGQIEETIAPEVLTDIVSFIKAATKN